MNNDNGGVINFFDIKKKAIEKSKEPVENSNEDMIEDGVDVFNEALALGAQGFISIVFDEDAQPFVVVAGDIDPFRTVGVLELCKMELMSTIVYSNTEVNGGQIEFIDDDSEDDN